MSKGHDDYPDIPGFDRPTALSMPLRDYFAGQALSNLAHLHAEKDAPGGKREWQPDVIASWSYALADAMLAERAK